MRVAIAGGHGKIALALGRLLSERSDQVVSLIRNPDHGEDVKEAGGEPVVCDLEAADAAAVADAVGAADAVVFAAGAGPGSGAVRKETMDFGGAVKLIEAATANGIDRYAIISSMGADPSAEGDETFSAYLRAKGRADAALRESGLDYTIVRPTSLTDDPGTGQVEVGEHLASAQIPRADVAAVLDASLHMPVTIGKTFELTSGEIPIEEALASLAG